MRNGNGTGSVTKLSGNRRNKYRVYAPAELVYDENKGDYVYKQKTIGYAKTKTEAYNILYLYNSDPIIKNKLTFIDLLNNYKDKCIKNTDVNKLKLYESVFIFTKDLHNKILNVINENSIQILFDKSDLKYGTLSNYKSFISSVLNYALFKKYIDRNYMKYVLINKNNIKNIPLLFSEKEIEILWNNSATDISKITLILLYSGMRRAEIFDLKKHNIFIDERYCVGGVKTNAGINRIIPMHERLVPFFTEFYNKSNYNFIDKLDINYNNFYYRFMINNKEIGLCKHKIHDTRKTFITRLNNYNANITDISKIVGHSTGSITLDLYTVKDKEQLIKTVNLLP